MISSTFYSVPVLQQPPSRKDLKNLKGYLWFFYAVRSRLLLLWISVPIRICKTQQRSLSLFILSIFKPLVFLNTFKIISMPSIWGSAFDVSTFFVNPIFLFEINSLCVFGPNILHLSLTNLV